MRPFPLFARGVAAAAMSNASRVPRMEDPDLVQIEFRQSLLQNKQQTKEDDHTSSDTETISLSTEEDPIEELSCDSVPQEQDVPILEAAEHSIEVPLENALMFKAVRHHIVASLMDPSSSDDSDVQITSLVIGQPTRRRRKSVRFALSTTRYYDVRHERTPDECVQCWYDRNDKERFKDQTAHAARAAFLKNPGGTGNSTANSFLAWFTTEAPEFNEAAQGVLDRYDTVAEQVQSEEAMHSLASSQKSGTQHFVDLYSRHDNDNSGGGFDTIVGLEHFVLTQSRGEAEQLRRYVLEQAYEQGNNKNTGYFWNDAQSAPSKSRTTEIVAACLVQFSQTVSRPTRILAQEMAMAQAKLLSL